ncbi:MAG: phosphoserine phosphatase SerB [Burkholderiales bacterium]
MNLIIQGVDVFTQDLKQLAKLSGAGGIEKISAEAFRLTDADPTTKPAVATHCENARLDFAFVPQSQHLKNFGLLVTDMDSTLITIECIDEIADMLGIKGQVAAITASTMRGEMDFAESLNRRVALLKGLDESALQRVYDERLQLTPGAEKLLAKCKAAGIKTLLVSGGFTFFTSRLKAKLGLDYTASCQLEISAGKLTGRLVGPIVDAQGKADWLERIRRDLKLKKENVIGIGDGANDLKMLAASGVSIAFHAKPVVREQATYALNYSGLDAVTYLFDGTD